MKMMPKEQKTESKERYTIEEVPTQTGFFIKDNKTNEIMDDKGVLMEILNKLDNIERATV